VEILYVLFAGICVFFVSDKGCLNIDDDADDDVIAVKLLCLLRFCIEEKKIVFT